MTIYDAIFTAAAARIHRIFAEARRDGPVYDPTYDHSDAGGGRTCSKCRRIVRYDVRVCPSCGTINR